MSAALTQARSFRDPDGHVVVCEARVFRLVKPEVAELLDALLSRPCIQEWMLTGRLVKTRRADPATLPSTLCDDRFVAYEHERIEFVSYPFEWSPAMLAAAAELTLELADTLLDEGYVLKDAKPSNVLFRGTQPVFIDILSIVPRAHGTYLWLAANQFESTFLLPLLLNAHAAIPLSWSLQDSHFGLRHSQAARILGLRRWINPRLIMSVALPAALEGQQPKPSSTQKVNSDDAAAKFILRQTIARYRKRVQHFTRHAADSYWAEYTKSRHHYAERDIEEKKLFVESVLTQVEPKTTLDIGSNTGEFSRLAARLSKVVALDIDETSVATLFRNAHRDSLDIQPLVADFGRPSPGLGWHNAEYEPLLDRIRGRFDLIMMLAVIHHLRTTSGVPIAMILDTVAALAPRYVLLEHVPPSDPMFRQLAKGRDDRLYSDCDEQSFRAALTTRFEIVQEQHLGNGRRLYLVKGLTLG